MALKAVGDDFSLSESERPRVVIVDLLRDLIRYLFNEGMNWILVVGHLCRHSWVLLPHCSHISSSVYIPTPTVLSIQTWQLASPPETTSNQLKQASTLSFGSQSISAVAPTPSKPYSEFWTEWTHFSVTSFTRVNASVNGEVIWIGWS